MKVAKKELPRGQAELNIELSVTEYQPFLKQATLAISEKTAVKGFRPGKAPYEVIKQNVGEHKIWEEALEPAVQKTLLQALEQEKLITVGSPKIEVEKLAPGNSVVFKATVNLMPKVELSHLDEIKVAKKPVAISDDQVQKTLGDLQKMRAKEVLVARPAQAGDKVLINFTGYLDSVPLEGGEQKNFPVIIGENHFIPGFEKNLIGLKKNDQKEFTVKFPDQYHQRNLSGRDVDFKVKVLDIYEIKLPALNDELAKNLGHGFKDLSDLREQLKKNLILEAERRENQRLESEILDKLIAKSRFTDIPELLVNTEAQKMLQELEQNIVRQGLKFEDYLKHLKKQRSDLLLDFVPMAIKRIKSALVLRAVAKQKDIKVSASELDLEVEKMKQQFTGNAELKKQLENLDYQNYLTNVLMSQKVLEFLKQKLVQ